MIAGQIASMDRLVMRDPVPKEVETLHPVCHVDSNLPRVTGRRVHRKH